MSIKKAKRPKNLKRVLRALAREGLEVQHRPGTWSVRLQGGQGPPAEVLLPDSLPIEAKALRQLANLAAVQHPDGGRVVAARATPDFHPGDSGVAIGSVVLSEGQVIPQAVGGDINCGMRLHMVDVPVDRFLAQRDRFVEALKGDYFLGTRDLPQTAAAQRAMFSGGLPAWLETLDERHGRLQASSRAQLESDLRRVHLGGGLAGDLAWAPSKLVPDEGLVRDDGLATIGGGNHFVELQVVEEVLDRGAAWRWGVREGCLAFMIHSGSRHVGKLIGRAWWDRARDAWPKGHLHPASGLFPLVDPTAIEGYLRAEATAANYGFLNRALLAELMRLRLREAFGAVEAPLVYDLPHNITLPFEGGLLARKGACPAELDQPVIVPGSMGAASYLLRGLGEVAHLCTASHGAGRAKARFGLHRSSEAELGLEGVDCVTLRPERRIEEAPAAYKPIQPVIDAQVEAGVVSPVARLRPLLTFKA